MALFGAGKAERGRYAGQAVATLREAVRRGLTRPEEIATAPEFQPLRGREDFQELLREVKQKSG